MSKLKRVNPFQEIYDWLNQDNRTKYANLPDFPLVIDVEVTNRCNMRCKMCPTGQGIVKRDKGDMSMPLYKTILEQIAPHKTPIRFIRWGEPLLSIFIEVFVEMAVSKGIMCHINTNAKLFTEEVGKWMCAIPLTSVKFSMQGTNKTSFDQYRIGMDYVEFMEKLKWLYAYRKPDSLYPFIQLGTTVANKNKTQIENFIYKNKTHCDAIYVGATRELSRELTILNYCQCPEVFGKLSIDWDGKVTACCGDYDNFMVVGDLAHESLESIWKGEKMDYYRQKLLINDRSGLELCKKCARPANAVLETYDGN